MTPPAVPIVDRFEPLARGADFFVIDQWGCLHDGVTAHPGAIELLEALRRLRRPVALVSNSSRPAAPSRALLERIGFPLDLMDAMLTAGELARLWLAAAWSAGQVRRALSLLGPPGPESVLRTMGFPVTDVLAEADVIVVSGISRVEPTQLDGIFQEAVSRAVPLLCLNPDIQSVQPDGSMVYCPGAYARRFHALGGAVRSWGKPGREIYAAARAALGSPSGRGLGVGDSLEHDIQGALGDDLGAVWVARGIHWRELGLTAPGERPTPDAVRRSCARWGIWPTAVVPTLRW